MHDDDVALTRGQIIGFDTQYVFTEDGGDQAYQQIAVEIAYAWAH